MESVTDAIDPYILDAALSASVDINECCAQIGSASSMSVSWCLGANEASDAASVADNSRRYSQVGSSSRELSAGALGWALQSGNCCG